MPGSDPPDPRDEFDEILSLKALSGQHWPAGATWRGCVGADPTAFAGESPAHMRKGRSTPLLATSASYSASDKRRIGSVYRLFFAIPGQPHHLSPHPPLHSATPPSRDAVEIRAVRDARGSLSGSCRSLPINIDHSRPIAIRSPHVRAQQRLVGVRQWSAPPPAGLLR